MISKNNNVNYESKYAEDWLPIKNIANGMIQTDDGYYVTGVKIEPRNIFILDQGMQNSVLSNLGNFYNTLDFEFWILISDRPVDIDVYLAQLQLRYNKTTDGAQRKLIMQDINKGNMFKGLQYSVIDTEYFLLFKEKRMELVQKKLHNIMSGLAGAGLQSSQTSNNDIRNILDNYLNDGKSTNFGAVM